jgi:clathrin heavy chain
MVFTHVTMQSEHYVCVRATGEKNEVVIVSMQDPTGTPLRRPITADSTILAPSSKTLALKAGGEAGDNLQVFNLDTKQKLKSFVNPAKVMFWTWVNDKTIALVTENAVFHWSMEVRGQQRASAVRAWSAARVCARVLDRSRLFAFL